MPKLQFREFLFFEILRGLSSKLADQFVRLRRPKSRPFYTLQVPSRIVSTIILAESRKAFENERKLFAKVSSSAHRKMSTFASNRLVNLAANEFKIGLCISSPRYTISVRISISLISFLVSISTRFAFFNAPVFSMYFVYL